MSFQTEVDLILETSRSSISRRLRLWETPKACIRGKMVFFVSSPKSEHVENFTRKQEKASCPVSLGFFCSFSGNGLKIQVEEAAFSSGWVPPNWTETELLERGNTAARRWRAAQPGSSGDTGTAVLGGWCLQNVGGFGCTTACTAPTSPCPQLLWLTVFLPSPQLLQPRPSTYQRRS